MMKLSFSSNENNANSIPKNINMVYLYIQIIFNIAYNKINSINSEIKVDLLFNSANIIDINNNKEKPQCSMKYSNITKMAT